jgi:HK97 family phage prohead protease
MTLRTTLHRYSGCDGTEQGALGQCVTCVQRAAADNETEEINPLWVRFQGIASMTEVPYEMWDMFGPYTERVSAHAFDASLASNPDVAFLCNHAGITMARTTNNMLTLTSAPQGLAVDAWANYERNDVRDFTLAVREGNIDQMSFAAFLEEGEWNDDFTAFTMTRLDLNCGDVSGVNFGANPYTSISARAHRVLEEIDRLPAGVARVATRQLEARLGAVPASLAGAVIPAAGTGRSLSLIRSALMADDDA